MTLKRTGPGTPASISEPDAGLWAVRPTKRIEQRMPRSSTGARPVRDRRGDEADDPVRQPFYQASICGVVDNRRRGHDQHFT